MNAIKLRIYEQTLTDGSKTYGVVVGVEIIDCATEAQAEELAEQIERLSLNTKFDGFNRVQLAA